MRKNRIPWAGVLIGIVMLLYVIFIILLGGYILNRMFMQLFLASIEKIPFMTSRQIMFFYVTSNIGAIILALISLGLFYGKRIVVFITLIIFSNNIIYSFLAIFKNLIYYDKSISFIIIKLLIILILGIFIYLSFKCLQHPYYGGDGRKFEWGSLKSWGGWKRLFLGEKAGIRGEEMTTF